MRGRVLDRLADRLTPDRRPWSLLVSALTVALVVTFLAMIVVANRMLAVAAGAAVFAVIAAWLSDRRRRRPREPRDR